MADFRGIFPIIIFAIFMMFTVKDLYSSGFDDESSTKEIPNYNLGPTKFVGPVVKIYYCYSCGYKNAFDEYSYVISKRYPDMVVEGSLYPPPLLFTLLARVFTMGKLLFFFCVVTGADVARYLGRYANFWFWCMNNKFYACIMVFLLSNVIESQLISTGAFEITFNDVPIWSKLETGRIPQPSELFQIIDNQLQFNAKPYIPQPSF